MADNDEREFRVRSRRARTPRVSRVPVPYIACRVMRRYAAQAKAASCKASVMVTILVTVGQNKGPITSDRPHLTNYLRIHGAGVDLFPPWPLKPRKLYITRRAENTRSSQRTQSSHTTSHTDPETPGDRRARVLPQHPLADDPTDFSTAAVEVPI